MQGSPPMDTDHLPRSQLEQDLPLRSLVGHPAAYDPEGAFTAVTFTSLYFFIRLKDFSFAYSLLDFRRSPVI